jgi:Ca2+-binding RTX toxin-like protein
MYGGVGSDTLNGDDGNDAVYGGWGNDTVNGGPGDDTLVGDAGNDTISGDTGGDLIQAVDDQKDQINCAGGRDKVYFDKGLDELRRCEGLNPR